jgi:hypothetical protein
MRLNLCVPTIREKVEAILERKGRSIPWLAEQMELKSPSLLYKWLDGEVKNPRDGNVWAKMAHILGVDEDDLTDPIRDPLKKMGYPKQDFRGVHLAELLLKVIENPDAAPEDKQVAKYTILEMLRER